MPKRRRTFLGYATFYDGKPFPCSGNTVTKNRQYLMAHALFKLNRINRETLIDRADCSDHIRRMWRRVAWLTLRKVYADA